MTVARKILAIESAESVLDHRILAFASRRVVRVEHSASTHVYQCRGSPHASESVGEITGDDGHPQSCPQISTRIAIRSLLV